MTGRAVPEWSSDNPNAAIPARVRLRVFERFGGRCALTGRKILPGDAWDLDHARPLADGGRHAESNLQPVLRDKHREKTAAEAGPRAKADRTRAKFLGIHPPSRRPLKGRPFAKSRPEIEA